MSPLLYFLRRSKMFTKRVRSLMIHLLMAVAILAACAPAATEAPPVATEPPQVATEEPAATEAPATTEEPAATEAPAEITDTELNVLCTPQEQWCQGMKQEFEAKYGITVNYVRMSSGEALARVQAEKDNPQFDIWWGGPIDSFVAAKQEGLLETYESPNFDNLIDPTIMKDVDNQWVGVYMGTLGFATNTDWLADNPGVEAPTSWDDLLRPEFTGQVMVAHPSSSGTSYTALATILQLRGEEEGWAYLDQYADQISQFTKSG